MACAIDIGMSYFSFRWQKVKHVRHEGRTIIQDDWNLGNVDSLNCSVLYLIT